MGDLFFDLDTTVTPTDVGLARSRRSIFNVENDIPDAGYQGLSGARTTYGPVNFKYQKPA